MNQLTLLKKRTETGEEREGQTDREGLSEKTEVKKERKRRWRREKRSRGKKKRKPWDSKGSQPMRDAEFVPLSGPG